MTKHDGDQTMTKTATKQTAAEAPSANGAAPIDYDRLMALSSANVEAMIKGGEAVLRGLAQINEELMSFTSSQIKEQVEGTRAIAQCGTWSEMLGKQMSLARQTTEQCLAEAGKLAQLAAEVTAASWAPFQSALGDRGPEKRL
jgi:hypothetical protein